MTFENTIRSPFAPHQNRQSLPSSYTLSEQQAPAKRLGTAQHLGRSGAFLGGRHSNSLIPIAAKANLQTKSPYLQPLADMAPHRLNKNSSRDDRDFPVAAKERSPLRNSKK